MMFNSFEFIFFFIIVVGVYYALNRNKFIGWRNFWLLFASFYFYGSFKPTFLTLLTAIILTNYLGALSIEYYRKKPLPRKVAIISTVVLSIGILGCMKYAYLIDSSIILPVGLSFFTFQAVSYSIDVYRGKIAVEKNLVKVALFISFLPTILSGPIERAKNIFPQLDHPTPMNASNLSDGIRQFIWGVFKKMVIADRLALYVNEVYFNPTSHSGTTLALAAFFYSIQIYCDFSGYADMAIGVGRVMGFRIIENFRFPYFALTIKDFWRRWHISLNNWFTEYVYITMGGNRVVKWRWVLNILTVFILSGIWHGATTAFIIWGAIHAVAYLIEYFLKIDKPHPLYGLLCFIVVTIAWIFFRIEDSSMAMTVVGKIFTDFGSILKTNQGGSAFSFYLTLAILMIFIIREIVSYRATRCFRLLTNIECVVVLCLIALFGVTSGGFVYFQF